MTSPERFDSKKKTLLLIHGYQGGAIAQWSPNVEELSKADKEILKNALNLHGVNVLSSNKIMRFLDEFM